MDGQCEDNENLYVIVVYDTLYCSLGGARKSTLRGPSVSRCVLVNTNYFQPINSVSIVKFDNFVHTSEVAVTYLRFNRYILARQLFLYRHHEENYEKFTSFCIYKSVFDSEKFVNDQGKYFFDLTKLLNFNVVSSIPTFSL